MGRHFALQSGYEVLRGHGGHLGPSGDAGRGDMRHDHTVVKGEKRVVHGDRFRLGDIQATGSDLTRFESLVEGLGSTMGPREVLMRIAVGFISLNCSVPIR